MNDPTTWGRGERSLYDRWPKDEAGTPEQAVFLIDLPDSGVVADMTVTQLEAYGIPVMKRYEKDGTLGRVVLGFSGYGVSLYVPASRLEEAKGLLETAQEPSEEE